LYPERVQYLSIIRKYYIITFFKINYLTVFKGSIISYILLII